MTGVSTCVVDHHEDTQTLPLMVHHRFSYRDDTYDVLHFLPPIHLDSCILLVRILQALSSVVTAFPSYTEGFFIRTIGTHL